MVEEDLTHIKRRFKTENKSVYVNLFNGSWQYIKEGKGGVKELSRAVYVSEKRYLDMVSRYNLIKNHGNPHNENLNDLVNYGEEEEYKGDNGGIFGIKPNEGMKRSSRVLKIEPPFEEILLTIEE